MPDTACAPGSHRRGKEDESGNFLVSPRAWG